MLTRLWEVVSDQDTSGEFSYLGRSEKKRIREIVGETVKRLPECWTADTSG